MDRLISEQAVIKAVDKHTLDRSEIVLDEDITVILEEVPSVAISSAEQKTGHWIHYEGMLICSECGTEFYDDIMEYCGDDVPKCCPDCGRRMFEPQKGANE